MPNSKSSAVRWTANQDGIQTRGAIEFLTMAVAELGPFEEEVLEAAARREVEDLARNFNHKIQANQGAPRVAHVVERLEKVAELSTQLADHLESLDDVTRLQLLTCGTGHNETAVAVFHPSDADIEGLPPVGVSDGGRWIARLRALSQSVQLTTFQLQASHVDKGGNTNLYKTMVGEPRFCLVQEGLIIFEKHKPGEATGTVGANFHQFLMNVFEYATGLNQNDHAKLEQWLKKLPKAYRRMRQIRIRTLKLEAEVEEIYETVVGPAEDARLGELVAERVSLDREYAKLWPLLCGGRS